MKLIMISDTYSERLVVVEMQAALVVFVLTDQKEVVLHLQLTVFRQAIILTLIMLLTKWATKWEQTIPLLIVMKEPVFRLSQVQVQQLWDMPELHH